jgi:hypothetical protein
MSLFPFAVMAHSQAFGVAFIRPDPYFADSDPDLGPDFSTNMLTLQTGKEYGIVFVKARVNY